VRSGRAAIVFLSFAVGGPVVAGAIWALILATALVIAQMRHGDDVFRGVVEIVTVVRGYVMLAFFMGGPQAALTGAALAVGTLRNGAVGYAIAALTAAVMAVPGILLLGLVWRFITSNDEGSKFDTQAVDLLAYVWLWMLYGALSALVVRWLLGVLRILPVPLPASATPASCKRGKS
jgi:hypothetical protein